MSAPTFSVLHASYGRSAKAVAAMRMWFDRAANPASVEYIFACNEDDPTHAEIIAHEATRWFNCKVVVDSFKGSAPAWDAAAKASTGVLLIQSQDDLEPEIEWDRKLSERLVGEDGEFIQWEALPIAVFVADGYRKDDLAVTAIMSQKYYEQKGEFLHAGYISMWSDNEWTYRARRDASEGLVTLIEARDLVFLHRHCYHDSSVLNDDTYRRTNRDEAYAQGAALFAQRNPEAAASGLVTWR